MENDHRRPFDFIIFDLGSTLIYFTGDWQEVQQQARQVMLQALCRRGMILDEQTFLKDFVARSDEYRAERETEYFERPIDKLLQSVLADHGYPDVSLQQLSPILAEMYTVSQSRWRTEPDSVSTLEALQAAGYRLGLISNAAYEEDVYQLVDQAGLRSYFEFILVSAGVGYRKPHSKIFQAALDFWGAKAAQVLMVGDTLGADVVGAQRLGMSAVWITRRTDPAASQGYTGKVVPDATIATLSELPELLKSWKKTPDRQSG